MFTNLNKIAHDRLRGSLMITVTSNCIEVNGGDGNRTRYRPFMRRLEIPLSFSPIELIEF